MTWEQRPAGFRRVLAFAWWWSEIPGPGRM